jgi:hypothetical protein
VLASEVVAFATSTVGFATHSIAKTIGAAVANRILALRVRDEITDRSPAFPVPGCWPSPPYSETKRGKPSFGGKPSLFVAIGRSLPLIILVDNYPVIEVQKAAITGAI